MKAKSPDASPPSEKTVSFKSIPDQGIVQPSTQKEVSKDNLINDKEIE
jgi:hypothetical protein